MDDAARLVEALRRLQRDDAAGALALAADLTARNPGNARAHVATGMALRMMGRLAEALALVETADPRDPVARHEKGWILHRSGQAALAAPLLEAAAAADPANAQWQLDAAKALADAGRDDAARSAYERAARAQTANAAVRIAYGRFLVSRADYAGAADAFAAARS